MTKIRISGVCNLADARAAAAQNIDFLGLNLTAGTENAISPIKVADYVQWLSGVSIVAELKHLTEEKALRFLELLNLKYAEILSENAVSNHKALWHFSENDSFEQGLNHVVLANPIAERAQVYQNAFVRIRPLNAQDIETYLAKGVSQFDIYLPAFKRQADVKWEEMDAFIARIRQ